MKIILYNQITPNSAIGLGFDISAAAAWSILTTYAQAAAVTSGGKTYVSRKGSNTGNAVTSAEWWVEVDTVTGIPLRAQYAKIQADGANCRYTEDGVTTPTAAIGLILYDGSGGNEPIIVGHANPLANVKVIKAAGSPKVSVQFGYN